MRHRLTLPAQTLKTEKRLHTPTSNFSNVRRSHTKKQLASDVCYFFRVESLHPEHIHFGKLGFLEPEALDSQKVVSHPVWGHISRFLESGASGHSGKRLSNMLAPGSGR